MHTLAVALICIFGALSQYAPGVMDRVIASRQAGRTARPLPQELPAVDGYIAVLSCRDIGQTRMLRYEGESYTMLIADCAGDARARQWMTSGGVIAEVDYEFAREHGFVRRGVQAELCAEDTQP